MELASLNRGYLAGGLILLLLASTFLGFTLRDYRAKLAHEEAARVLVVKDQEIAAVQGRVQIAELKAASAEGAQQVAETRYRAALARLTALEERKAHPPTTTTTTTATPDPGVDTALELLAEHEARIACGDALDAAHVQIDALKGVAGELRQNVTVLEQRDVLKDRRISQVEEECRTQERRKKGWRTTALGAIAAGLLLLL